MQTDHLLKKALNKEFLTIEEGLFLYQNDSIGELMFTGNEIKKSLHPNNFVSWIIDRNVNITNVCTSGCLFCNFYRTQKSEDAYITSIEQYKEKINELKNKNGNQLLLQGGLHPKLGMDFYENLFRQLKEYFPEIKLHALGPAEIVHLSKLDNISYEEVLKRLTNAGLDSLPGAGAEILHDRVRKIISKIKCSADEWLNVIRTAHKMNILTSATMMFGHIETIEERIFHLISLRNVQQEKPANSVGFISFIPWPFQDKDTVLKNKMKINNTVSGEEYIRMIAISRILLPNIPNIQASWLTVGKDIAQLCLYAGANDFGSIMIEENVVSSAGANYQFDAKGIQQAIIEAGFIPRQRNQKFESI